jgi:hypothetical protein
MNSPQVFQSNVLQLLITRPASKDRQGLAFCPLHYIDKQLGG